MFIRFSSEAYEVIEMIMCFAISTNQNKYGVAGLWDYTKSKVALEIFASMCNRPMSHVAYMTDNSAIANRGCG